jgi:stearoyl-CoA desaturase (delta-9 desaturase)
VALFVTTSPFIAVAGTIWWVAAGQFHPQTLALAAGMAVATGLGVTGGYHRLFSHRSYRAPWPTRLILLLLGGASFEESALSWCRDHRNHHRFLDRQGDPYNIANGFWHAHFFWMFRKPPDAGRWPVDLWSDPLLRLQHRFYLPAAALVGLALPAGIASLWGDARGGLLIAGFARIVVNHHLTFAINSVCHYLGRQPYSDQHSARDNWVTALFTYGEGYHNFHHEFPSDYRNGHERHHWDPTKWLIYALSRLRLASRLRASDREVVASRRIAMQEKRVRERLGSLQHAQAAAAGRRIAAAKERLEAALAKVRAQRSLPSGSSRDGARCEAGPAKRERKLRLALVEFDRAVALWNATVRGV